MAPPLKLLSLPTEIIDLIIDKYLENVPIKEAWHAREVCKTFKNTLTAAVPKLPASAFETGRTARNAITGLLAHGKILLSRTTEPRFRVLWCSNVLMLQFLLRPISDIALTHMLVKGKLSEWVHRTVWFRKFREEAHPLQSVVFLFRLKKETDGEDDQWLDERKGRFMIDEYRRKLEAMRFVTKGKIVGMDEDNSGELAWGAPK